MATQDRLTQRTDRLVAAVRNHIEQWSQGERAYRVMLDKADLWITVRNKKPLDPAGYPKRFSVAAGAFRWECVQLPNSGPEVVYHAKVHWI